jgi:hypothetical protein
MKNKHNNKIIQKINKKFQTTIIGCLARFEENFGYLWSYDSDKPLTEREAKFLEIWEYTRTSILNHGNNQMRSAIDDLVDFIEKDTMYKYNFIVKQSEDKKETE